MITTACGLGTYGLSVLTGPLLARALSTGGRGAYGAVNVPTQIVGWLLMFGLPLSTAFHAGLNERKKLWATSWAFLGLIGVPIVAVLWFLVPSFLHQYPPVVVHWFRAYLVASLLILPYQAVYEYLRATGANIRFNVYRSLPLVANALGVALLYAIGRLTLNTAFAAMLVCNVVIPLVGIGIEGGYVLPTKRWFDRSLAKVQLSYGRRAAFGTLSTMVLARFDQFLMVSLVTPSELGLYAIAVTGAGMTAPIAQGVGFALFPYLRRERDPHAGWRRTWQAFRWVVISSVAMSAIMALIAPWGLPAIMGAAFAKAVPAFMLLLPGQVCWNAGEVFKAKLEADGSPGLGAQAVAVAAVITIVVDPFVVRWYGIQGAAVVTSLSQFAYAITAWSFVQRRRPAGAGRLLRRGA